MPEKMTADQSRAFLAEGARTVTIATVRADGRPHAVPVWFVLDGDDIVITLKEDSVKGRNLIREPRVTAVVDDPTPPYAFVSVDGTAEISRDPDEIRRFATEIGRRYIGDEGAEGFAGYVMGSGMVVGRVRPNHVVGYDKIAG